MTTSEDRQPTTGNRPCILIVDDRKANLAALRKVLSEVDAEIVEATSGNAALTATLDREFVLAILDVQMPGMDGYELAGLLRGDARTRRLPIIFITATHPDEECVFKGYEAGAVDYLVKPYNPVVLLAKVRVFLELHAKTAELAEKVEALAASEERFRVLVMTVPDIVFRMDPEGRFTFLNEAVRSLGYAPEDLLRRHFSEIMLPADVDDCVREVVLPRFVGKQTGPDGAPSLFDERRTGPRLTTGLEVRLIPRLGKSTIPAMVLCTTEECIVAEVSSSGLYAAATDKNQRVFLGTVGVIRDITERKRAEEELRKHRDHLEELVAERTAELWESETRFRQIAETIGEVFWIATPEIDRMIYVSPAYETIWGRTCASLYENPRSFIDAVEPKDREGLLSELSTHPEGKPFECEYRIIRPDGTIRWIHDQGSPVFDADGILKNFVGVARDITGRKQAEEERERLYTAMEQAAETILITDVQGNIVYCNPAFEKTSGYTRQEALGQNPRILRSGKQDAAFYTQMWERLTHGKVWEGHFINKRKDGTLYEEETTISPVRETSGAIVNFVAVKRDITHELELEAQLRQAQRLESVGRLAGGVAHDFNNLLSVIIGFSQLAYDQLLESDPLRQDIREIEQAGERAAALTRQLLAFSRKQVLMPKVIDLNRVIADVEKMLGRLLGEDIDIALHLPDGLGSVMADPGQIEQVIVNLCVNARDAMPGGGKLTIETANIELDQAYASRHAGVTPGRYVMVSITDTGCGMDEGTREHIFEPFFTTKEKGKGTGLGLATVYGIIKQSGGDILVYSEPGHGTTFKIYLPRVDAPAVDAKPKQPTTTMATGSETVLIVEDEDSVRGLAEHILRQAGYNVLSAANGGEALLLCEKHGAVDLVLTDVVMPLMSGRELVERLAMTSPGLKVLYMSGYTDNAIVQHGVLDPGTRFIAKPFSIVDLTRRVREALDEGGSVGV